MTQVPIFDGSAKEWVDAIKQVGLKVATDQGGNSCEKMIPFLTEPVYVHRNDSFIAAFPCQRVQIIYGINFPQVKFLCIGVREIDRDTLLSQHFSLN